MLRYFCEFETVKTGTSYFNNDYPYCFKALALRGQTKDFEIPLRTLS